MPLPNLKSLLTGGASNLVDSVKNVISEFHLSPEDKLKAEQELTRLTNEHIEKMATLAQAEFEAQVKDMDSARNREIQIAVADKAPLINKIISPILAILILGSTFLMWYIILFKDIPKEKEALVAGIVGSLTTLSMAVVGYYFGSSVGSKQKSEQLDKISSK